MLEDDQFAQKIGNAEGGQADEQALSMLGGMAGKIQLNSMFEELIKMYDAIKSKIAVLNWVKEVVEIREIKKRWFIIVKFLVLN